MFKCIKHVFHFLYHFMFIDQATGQLSNTKFFANVGYMIWCYIFPWVVQHGSQAPMELWLVFGAVVIGNRTLNVWMQNKAGAQGDPDSTWKGVASPLQPAAPSTSVSVQVNVPPADDLVDK